MTCNRSALLLKPFTAGVILLFLFLPISGQTLESATRAERSYLANEDTFAFIKAMQQKNLIVPIVGDFAGPKALRSLGTFLRSRGATVSAFYVSNVEMYLQNNGVWPKFCANVAAMPLDAGSTFIRPEGGNSWASGQFGAMAAETAACPK
jgi:hypothetical protein